MNNFNVNVRDYYALVGNFSTRKDCDKGISVFHYDLKTGIMELASENFSDRNIGQQFYDRKRDLIYFTEETNNQPGQTGGGGNVAAARLNRETGSLELISRQKSLGSNPSYITIDGSGRFAVVVHHCTSAYVTKLLWTGDHGFETKVEYDDCTIVLLPVERDGKLGEPCAAVLLPGGRELKEQPSLHAAVTDHSGRYFVICDTRLDQIYVYTIDPEQAKLRCCCQIETESGTHPRYAVFHPKKQLVYVNFEDAAMVSAFSLNPDGQLAAAGKLNLLTAPYQPRQAEAMPSDIVISPEGDFLYVSIRQLDLIAAVKLDESGRMSLLQNIPCGGRRPRGLYFSPEDRRLLAANTQTQGIVGFAVEADGTLTAEGVRGQTNCPGNIQII